MAIDQEYLDRLVLLGVTIHTIEENDPVLLTAKISYTPGMDTHYVMLNREIEGVWKKNIVHVGNHAGVEAVVMGYFSGEEDEQT